MTPKRPSHGTRMVTRARLSDWFGGENYMASKIGNKVDLDTRNESGSKGTGEIVQVHLLRAVYLTNLSDTSGVQMQTQLSFYSLFGSHGSVKTRRVNNAKLRLIIGVVNCQRILYVLGRSLYCCAKTAITCERVRSWSTSACMVELWISEQERDVNSCRPSTPMHLNTFLARSQPNLNMPSSTPHTNVLH